MIFCIRHLPMAPIGRRDGSKGRIGKSLGLSTMEVIGVITISLTYLCFIRIISSFEHCCFLGGHFHSIRCRLWLLPVTHEPRFKNAGNSTMIFDTMIITAIVFFAIGLLFGTLQSCRRTGKGKHRWSRCGEILWALQASRGGSQKHLDSRWHALYF